MFNFIKWPLAAVMLLASLTATPSARARDGDHDGRKIGHVFVIVLENEGFDTTFGPNSLAPSCRRPCRARG
jgi:phosphatidylinositol-3-phosphatase